MTSEQGQGNVVDGSTVYGSVVQAGGSIDSVVIRAEPMPLVMPGAPIPRALPALTTHFTNRLKLLDELATAVRAPAGAPSVVTFYGPGGVGKSAMALKLASLVGDRFPDAHLYTDLRGASAATAAPPAEALRCLLGQLGVHPRQVPVTPGSQSDLFRSLVAQRRVLVLLDNAHSAAQVRPLLSGSAGSLTLVTSRWGLPRLVSEFGARPVPVEPLDPADALRLLAKFGGGTGTRAMDRYAEVVAAQCAGMPYALCSAGAQFATRRQLTWGRLAQEITEPAVEPAGGREAEPAGVWEAGPERGPVEEAVGMTDEAGGPDGTGGQDGTAPAPEMVPRLLRGAYRAVSPEAARAHRMLALRPWAELGPEVVAAAARLPAERGPELLAELVDLHLLEPAGPGRYRCHDEIRRHAEREARRVEDPMRIAGALHEIVVRYLRLAVSADACVTRGRWYLGPEYPAPGSPAPAAYPDPASALAVLSRERENLVQAVSTATECGFDQLVWQLCEALWGLFLRLGFHQDWVATHRLGVAAAVQCADFRAEGRMRCQLAFAFMGLGEYADAEDQLTAALVADEYAGHARGQATALETLGLLRLKQGRAADAEECFVQARERAAVVGDPRALALLEHHVGRALRAQSRYPEAVAQLHRAHELMCALPEPDPYNEARVLTSLGETLLDGGRPLAAAEPLAQAAVVMDQMGAELQQAEVAALRARCARATGDAAAELRHVTEVVRHHRATGSPEVGHWTARLAELTGEEGGSADEGAPPGDAQRG